MSTRAARCLTIVAMLGLGWPAWGAEPPRVSVQLEREQCYEGQSVGYQVEVSGVADAPAPELAGMDDFEVASLGQQTLDSRQMYIDGSGNVREVVHSGKQFQYRLTPRKTGKLKIPAPQVKVAGQVFRGREVTLAVLPPDAQDVAVVEIAADRPAVFPTQPFTIRLSVYLKELPAPNAGRDPMGIRTEPPELNIPWAIDKNLPEGLAPGTAWQKWLGGYQDPRGLGFRVNGVKSQSVFSMFESDALTFRPEPRHVLRRDRHGKEVGCRQYEFARTFTASRPGTFRFGPVSLQGTFVSTEESGSALVATEIYAAGKPVVVQVKDVPVDGRPNDYVGLIGRYQLAAELQPRQVQVGDPLTLTLTLTGQGARQGAKPPELARIPAIAGRFKLYEATQQTPGDSCVFTYSLRPLAEGNDPFPPLTVSYFDVEAGKFVRLHSPPMPLTVTKAEQLSASQIVTVRPASGGSGELQARREGVFANVVDPAEVRDDAVRPADWLAGIGGMTGAYSLAALAIVLVRRRAADPAAVRRRGAAGRALGRVRQAEQELHAGAARAAVDHIQAALTGLVADLTGQAEAGITPRDVCQHLAQLGLAAEQVTHVRTLLDACDAARYGAPAGDVALDRQALDVLQEVIAALKARRRFR